MHQLCKNIPQRHAKNEASQIGRLIGRLRGIAFALLASIEVVMGALSFMLLSLKLSGGRYDTGSLLRPL